MYGQQPQIPVPPAAPHYRQVSHLLHLILTILTLGMWAIFVWWWWAILVHALNSEKRKRYQQELVQFQQDQYRWDEWRRGNGPPPGPEQPPWWQ